MSIAKIKEAIEKADGEVFLTIYATDLKALAESHTRLLEAAKDSFEMIKRTDLHGDHAGLFTKLFAAITEAQK